MLDNPAKIWNSVEIYDVYCKFLSTQLTTSNSTSATTNIPGDSKMDQNRNNRALLVRKMEEHFGESLIVLCVNGCVNIVCFRKQLSETLKFVEADDNDNIAELAKKITMEAKGNSPKSIDTYNLGEFLFEKAQDSCN